MGRPDPIVLDWQLRTRADLLSAWRAFGDSDRFNRALGLEFTFEAVPNPDGSVRRTGTMKSFGLTLKWDERRFDFVALHGFHIERVMESGPLDRYTVDLRLAPGEVGTEVGYRVTAYPRNVLSVPLIALQLKLSDRPRLDRGLNALIDELEGRDVRFDPLPPPLPSAVAEEVRARAARMRDRRLADLILEHLFTGPLREQASMAPIELSEGWDLGVEEVALGLLDAVRVGILSLGWALICPSCQGGRRFDGLDAQARRVHCPGCNIGFDGGIVDAVEVVFRPAAWVREIDDAPRCVASPARTPHFVARGRVEPHDELEWSLTLLPGGHKIRSMTSLAAASVEAVEGEGPDTVVVDLMEDGVRPERLRVRAGAVRIFVRSRLAAPAWVVLERRWRPISALTAGRFLAMPGVREALPPGVLAPDLCVEAVRAGVLVTEAFSGEDTLRAVEALLAETQPKRSALGARALVATWPRFEQAVAAAERLEGGSLIASALGAGIVLELSEEQRCIASGAAVEEALLALRIALPGRTAVPASIIEDGEVKAALGSRTLLPGPSVDTRVDYLVSFGGAAAPPPSLVRPRVPTTDRSFEGQSLIGRYRLGARLGQGGFGSVYAAHDALAEREVVVKVLREDLYVDPLLMQQFFAEARTCSRLSHPNIVRMSDFGHDEDGRLFLVMERLDGRELAEIIRGRGVIDSGTVCRIACELLDGLGAAHAAGIVHRDLKPANVFVARAGAGATIKLIDFGIALDQSVVDLLAGKTVGTFRYMSPEQLGMGKVGPAADLYTVGLIMYRCLAGEVPYSDKSNLSIAALRIAEPCPPLSPIARTPPALVAVVMKAVERDPAARYASAEAMKAAILAAAPPEPGDLAALLEDDELPKVDTSASTGSVDPGTEIDPTIHTGS